MLLLLDELLWYVCVEPSEDRFLSTLPGARLSLALLVELPENSLLLIPEDLCVLKLPELVRKSVPEWVFDELLELTDDLSLSARILSLDDLELTRVFFVLSLPLESYLSEVLLCRTLELFLE